MKAIAVIILFVAVSDALNLKDLIREEWLAYKMEHHKNYNEATEENFRMKIFLENRNKIAKHNQKFEQGLHSFKLKLNKYSDMLPYEFVSTMNGFNKSNSIVTYSSNKESGATFISPANVKLPNSVDWRTKGAVTPVKDQGHCGSCWSFSATGSLEGQHFRKTGVLVSLSEQNLVDCSSSYGNNGCNGGMMDNAFRYVKDNGGIDTEKSYPYEGIDDTCHFEKSAVGATDKGFMDIPEGDEEKLMQAVAVHGPVSVAIDASQQSFQFYSEGVYYDEHCSSDQLDHGVLVVGYGTDDSGTDYWLVKNSWGTTWGDNGFIKMARNKNNHCGIATAASFPLV
ncbi:cathepsin L [Condylostylus longicornis]|uniref:cathepsin L n=1 Tax=Condylostylus longicornis TaxID=2530218 RepID=UPI00244E269A|nr:cathepsin L [Condylostylus longicornis]